MKTNTPKLRFREFIDEWPEKRFGDVAKFFSGGTPSKENPNFWGGNIPWISASSMHGTEYSSSDRTLTEDGVKHGSKIAKTGSILLLVRGSMLFNSIPVGITIKDVAYNQDVKAIESDKLVGRYILYFFQASENNLLSKVVGTGIGAGKLDLDDLQSLKIAVPTPVEQEKICGFLTTVDEKINKLEEKKKGFEKYKKGVMQAIFNQKIRFKNPDGLNYPNWEEKKLGEIGKFKTSGIDKLIKENQQVVRLVNYMNVYRHEGINVNNRNKLSETSVNPTQLIENNLNKGDILFTPSSETPSDIGHSVVIKEDLSETVYSYHLLRFRPSIELNLSFTHYFCNIPQVLKQMSRRSQGSTRFTITVGEFSKVRVMIPESLEEQEKIAEFLTSLENKINLINKQLEQSKLFKKSLLQQMFV